MSDTDDEIADAIKEMSVMPGVENFVTPKHRPLPVPLPVPEPLLPPRNEDEVRRDAADEVPTSG